MREMPLIGHACSCSPRWWRLRVERRGARPARPLEGFNRGVYRFNDEFDEWMATPVAGLPKALHQEIRTRVGNFFSNLQDLFIGVNNLLQGKPRTRSTTGRALRLTAFGLLGIHDVASEWG